MKYEKGTFTTIPNKEALRGLDPQSQVLFMWLCSYADDGGVCFPSIARLAKDCGVERRTIERRLKLLCDRGLLSLQQRYTEKGQTSNFYQIQLIECATP